MRNLVLVGVLIALGSCTATQDLANTCQGAATVLSTATDLRAKGVLTPTQISTIDTAARIINPICTSPTAPVDVSSAVNVVVGEVSVITPLIGGK